MKKKMLTAVFVLLLLASVVATTGIVGVGKANPFSFFYEFIEPDEYTKAPVISVLSPANNTVLNKDNVVLSFEVDVGKSETAVQTVLFYVNYLTDWQHDNKHFFYPESAPFVHEVNLTGIPEGPHSIVFEANERGAYNQTHAFSIANYETICFSIEASPETGGKSNGYLMADDYEVLPESAVSSEVWFKKYGENSNSRAESFIQASDGGFVVAGSTGFVTDSTESAPFLFKTDSDGNVEWNKTYSGGKYDYARSLVETSDGGYALVNSGMQMVKFDAYGNIEWNRTVLGGSRTNSFIQTSDGGYAIAGTSGDVLHGYEHYFWLAKTDEQGQHVWNRTYETVTTGEAAAVIQTLDGGYALLGSNNMNPDFLLVKTDSAGELEWSKQYEKRDWDTGEYLVQNSDGGYTLAGTLWNRSDNSNMAGIIKTDSNGDMLWMKNYLGSWGVSMADTSDGGYVICSDLMLTKTDSEGTIQWTKDLNSTADNGTYLSSHSAIQTHDGGYAILGTGGAIPTSDDPQTGTSYVWIMKTDATGTIPEFPSWTILPIFTIATLLIITCKQKLHKTGKTRAY